MVLSQPFAVRNHAQGDWRYWKSPTDRSSTKDTFKNEPMINKFRRKKHQVLWNFYLRSKRAMNEYRHKQFQTMRKICLLNKRSMTNFNHEQFQTMTKFCLTKKKTLSKFRPNFIFFLVKLACLRKPKTFSYSTKIYEIPITVGLIANRMHFLNSVFDAGAVFSVIQDNFLGLDQLIFLHFSKIKIWNNSKEFNILNMKSIKIERQIWVTLTC